MNEKRLNPEAALDEDELRRLMRSAGPRPEVPASELMAIKEAAREDWRRQMDRRSGVGRFAGWRAPLALAATLVAALSIGWWWRALQTAPVAAIVATVERVDGTARAEGSRLALGAELAAGAELETPASGRETVSRLALRLAGGQSVRLDQGSRVRLLDEASLELLRGAVYVDSGAEAGSLEIRTAYGNVRDIGTQFEVRVGENGETGSLRVRVREGEIALDRGSESHSAAAGEVLTVGPDGLLDRHGLIAYGEEWEWVLAAAPALEIEGRSLAEYLEWLARETGWRVRYADDGLARAATTIDLHGSIAGLAPDASVEVVLPSSGLEHRLEAGVLYVER